MTDEKELKDQRIPIMMTSSEVEAIDDWMFNNRIRSRGEAIRRLCQMGLVSDELTPELIKGAELTLEWANERIGALVQRNRENVPDDELANYMIGSFFELQKRIIDIFSDMENLSAGHELLKNQPSIKDAIDKLKEFRIEGDLTNMDDLFDYIDTTQGSVK